MKIGDKVRFLDTVGGGIVKAFQGKDIVIVDNDGFDTPVLIRDCVIIESANEVQVRQSVKSDTTLVANVTKKIDVEPEIKIEETKEGEQVTVCLVYLPVDIKQINTTGYEAYLVNDSNYYLSYNYMGRGRDGWISRASGIVEPNVKVFLEEFEKSDLNNIERVCLQFIAYKKDKPFKMKNPCSTEIRIDSVKFYKLHSFRENDYFDEDAIVYYTMRRDLPEKEMLISAEELSLAMIDKAVAERPKKQSIEKRNVREIIEVDLHIAEILDNTNGLESSDMLEYQLGKFREVLEQYKNQKGQKIVFIHGKGNGVLKNAILTELKNKYRNFYSQDASFREYGFGATMVTIK